MPTKKTNFSRILKKKTIIIRSCKQVIYTLEKENLRLENKLRQLTEEKKILEEALTDFKNIVMKQQSREQRVSGQDE